MFGVVGRMDRCLGRAAPGLGHFKSVGDTLLKASRTGVQSTTGWLDRPSLSGPDLAKSIWEGAERVLDGSRRYQTRILQGERTWWAFAPSRPGPLHHYPARGMHNQENGRQAQPNRGPKNQGRSWPLAECPRAGH